MNHKEFNNLGNDYDYAFSSSPIVFSKKAKKKIRKTVKRQTSKFNRRAWRNDED